MAECNTEEKCIDFLVQKLWGGTVRCGNKDCDDTAKLYYLKTRQLYKCSCCKKQFSIKQGTIFQSSTIPLTIWFMAIYIFTERKRGVSSVQLARDIGVQQKTAWLMLHKIREAMNEENDSILSGIVEIDEAYCGAKRNRDKRLSFKIFERKELRIEMDAEGKKEKSIRIDREKKYAEKTGELMKFRRDRLTEALTNAPLANRMLLEDKVHRMQRFQPIHYKKNILGMIEKDGNIVLKKVGRQRSDICEKKVMPILQKHITKDAHIMTDEHLVYTNVKKHFKQHSTVNHSRPKGDYTKKIVYALDGITTNRIENVWNQFKKMENGTYVHFSWKYTDRYLNEFAYRYNNRGLKDGELFNKLIRKVSGKAISNKKLTSIKDDYYYVAS